MEKTIYECSAETTSVISGVPHISIDISAHKVNFWETIYNSTLNNFDPSHLQNVTLGILAIFLPFAIALLTDIFEKNRDKKKYDFEKIALTKEVLKVGEIFFISIITIFLLSFGSKDNFHLTKIFFIVLSFITSLRLAFIFSEAVQFSEKKEYFISRYAKKTKISFFTRKSEQERIINFWSSFWKQKEIAYERDFTEFFINHVDSSLKKKEFKFSGDLIKTFLDNIEQRRLWHTSDLIFPKTLEWSFLFSEKENIERKKMRNKKQKTIIQKIKQKFFPIDYDFFRNEEVPNELLQKITEMFILQDRSSVGAYSLFKELKKYEKKNKVHFYKLLEEFLAEEIFNKIIQSRSQYNIWNHHFPSQWKINSSNIKQTPSIFFGNAFLGKIFQDIRDSEDNMPFNKTYNAVAELFPTIEPFDFSQYLVIFALLNAKRIPEINTIAVGRIKVLNAGEKRNYKKEYEEESAETIKVIDAMFNIEKHRKILTKIKEGLEEMEIKDQSVKQKINEIIKLIIALLGYKPEEK